MQVYILAKKKKQIFDLPRNVFFSDYCISLIGNFEMFIRVLFSHSHIKKFLRNILAKKLYQHLWRTNLTTKVKRINDRLFFLFGKNVKSVSSLCESNQKLKRKENFRLLFLVAHYGECNLKAKKIKG